MIEPSDHLLRVMGVTTGEVLVSADPLLDRVLNINWPIAKRICGKVLCKAG